MTGLQAIGAACLWLALVSLVLMWIAGATRR